MPAPTWTVHPPQVLSDDSQAIVKERDASRLTESRPASHVNERATGIQDDLDHPDFDEDDKWPRRLLHVPTMTSHKWRPQNSYAGISNPEYSIVSYTWGRWRIRDVHSQVEALNVKGVPWQVPKVNPNHFTAEQFERILHVIVGQSAKNYTGGKATPFVWVDVACIPQWQHSVIADSEVGRQARIFRGAREAYVWLTTADPDGLCSLFSDNQDISPRNSASDLVSFCHLLKDPWFGSMWTLQESFIQQAAFILTNKGICTNPGRRRPIDLFLTRGFAVDLLERRQYDRTKVTEELSMFREAWFRTGLQGPLSASPMQVLACAQFRTSEFELDRVYGIMQVFGDEFKVGKARAAKTKVPTKQSFELEELEDELGILILEKFPSTSQLFQHDMPPLVGRGWRICGRASVPRQLGFASGSFNDGLSMLNKEVFFPKPDCELSTIKCDSTTWATFRGKMCQFSDLVSCSRSTRFNPIWSEFHVYVDDGNHIATTDGADVDTVIEAFGADSLMVLLLSARTTLEVGRTVNLDGLLLVRPGLQALNIHQSRRGWHPDMITTGLQAWARIGVCQTEWYEERSAEGRFMSTLETETLLGTSTEWVYQEGTWG